MQFKGRIDTGVGVVFASKSPPCSIALLEILRFYPRLQLRESTGSCDRFVPVPSAAGGTGRRAAARAFASPVVFAGCYAAVDECRSGLSLMGGLWTAGFGARDSAPRCFSDSFAEEHGGAAGIANQIADPRWES